MQVARQWWRQLHQKMDMFLSSGGFYIVGIWGSGFGAKKKEQGYGNFALCVLFAQPWTPWGHGRQSRKGCVFLFSLFCLQNAITQLKCFIF